MKKSLPLVLFLAIIVFFFKGFFLHGLLPIPADTLVGLYHPFSDIYAKVYPRGVPFKNFLITDPIRQQYPWRFLSMEAFKHFQLPLWNPYNGAGEPLLANFQSAVFYPLNILFFILPFKYGWSILIFLQPLLAGIFFYLYTRSLGLGKNSSILGSLAFSFSGFMVAWLEWGVLGSTLLWIPLIFLSIDKLLHLPKKVLWSIVFLFALCSSFFAGHIQVFFYIFVTTLFYIIFRIISERRILKGGLLFVVLLGLFGVITAVQWIPTLQLIFLSSRTIDQNWKHVTGWFIPAQQLIQFIAPDFFGNPATLNYWGIWNYGEMVGYIGIIPIIFALFAVLKRRDKVTYFYITVVFFALLFSVQSVISEIPFRLGIPFISSLQPTRLLSLVDFGLSILAALGFESYSKKPRGISIILGAVAVGFFGAWIVALGKIHLGIDIANLAVAKRNLLLPTGLFLIASIVIYAQIFLQKKMRFKMVYITFALLFLITAFDMLRFAEKFNPFTPQSYLYPQSHITTYLQRNTQKYPWRMLGVDYVPDQKRIFPPNTTAYYGLYTLDSYNSLLIKQYQEFAGVLEWKFTDIPKLSFNRSIILDNYNSRLVDLMGVKYIVSMNPQESPKLNKIYSDGQSIVYENTAAFPRAFLVHNVLAATSKEDAAKLLLDKSINLHNTAITFSPLSIAKGQGVQKDSVTFRLYQPNKIVLDVKSLKGGVLVLTDTNYPTWKATIDGKSTKIYTADYAFRGIVIPAGKHTVVFQDNLF